MIQRGTVISLEGPLGAGKTQCVKGIAEGLGCAEEASSPSFTLAHEYAGGRLDLYHFDFYRLISVDELYGAGFRRLPRRRRCGSGVGRQVSRGTPSRNSSLEFRNFLRNGARRIRGLRAS